MQPNADDAKKATVRMDSHPAAKTRATHTRSFALFAGAAIAAMLITGHRPVAAQFTLLAMAVFGLEFARDVGRDLTRAWRAR